MLVCALGSAQVTAFEAKVRIDHAHQCQFREMKSLGHQLRADNHVDCAALCLRDKLRRAVGAAQSIAGDQSHAGFGQQFFYLVRNPLHPRTAGHHAVRLAAIRAGVGRSGIVPAVMAGETLGETMFDQPCAAIGALEAVSAIAAQGQRSIAATVEKQQRLLALFQPVSQCIGQPRGEPFATLRLLLGQIEQLDIGHLRAAEPAGQLQLAVNAALGHLQAFQRGCGAGQHHRDFLEVSPHHRHVAGVVTHTVVLFEADLVRFVHYDQAQIGVGQEQRGACADHDLRLACSNRAPRPPPLGRFQTGMPYYGLCTEAILEAAQERFGQGDFRQQDQHLPVCTQSGSERFEIGFGLARSGDPVEQYGGEGAGLHSLYQFIRHLALIVRQYRLCMVGIGPWVGAVDIHYHRFQHTLIDQPAQHPVRHACNLRQFADRCLLTLQPFHRPFALRSRAFGHSARQTVFGHRRRTAHRTAAGQHHARHRAHRSAVIFRRPFDQTAQFGAQRRYRNNFQ